jgi:26S proteasome regulatory subunit N7
VYLLVVRDFQTANELFVSAIPTFNAPEVMTYEDLIFYTVMTGVIFMSRADLKKKIIESPEATVQLQKMKDLNEYLTSFYSCNYKRLYQKLGTE